MKSSGVSAVSVVGDAEVIPMDVDVTKEGGDATRKGEPDVAVVSEAASSSEKPAVDKTAIVDMTGKSIEVDKPVGRPAEKKMPKPEKQKAPESKLCRDPKLLVSVLKQTLRSRSWRKPLTGKKERSGSTQTTWHRGSRESTAGRGG